LDKWDSEQQKVISKVSQSDQINGILSAQANHIMNIYRNAKEIGIEPGNVYLREKFKFRKVTTRQLFFDNYLKFIEEKNENWSIYTFRKIQTNYRHLRDFSEKSGYIIDFESINQDFYEKYISYFQQKKHSNSTIARNLDVLKWFLNWATRKGYNRNMYYRDFRFPWDHSYKTNPSDQYLEWDELICFHQAELPDPRQSHARDVFCFMCFTGLKYSQLKLLSKKANSIQILKQMAQTRRSVPFQKYINDILKRSNCIHDEGSKLSDIRMVNLNRLIKIAGKNAGLFKPVRLQIFQGSEKLTRDIPKYKLLSAKLARNTFIFHSLRIDVPLQYILKITGFKTLYGIRRMLNDASCNTNSGIIGILT
jgi:integrase